MIDIGEKFDQDNYLQPFSRLNYDSFVRFFLQFAHLLEFHEFVILSHVEKDKLLSIMIIKWKISIIIHVRMFKCILLNKKQKF